MPIRNASDWEDLAPFLFANQSEQLIGERMDQIVHLTGAHGGKVLDLACGVGAYSLEFAGRGFEVTAVDATPAFLKRAEAAAGERGLSVEWVEQEMRSFCRAGSFDLAASIFTSFGYYPDSDGDLETLRNVAESLRTGGVLFIDLAGKEVIARRFEPTGSTELDDGSILIERRRIVGDWSQIENQWMVVRDGNLVNTIEFTLNLYSARELKDLLRSAGFDEPTVYGSWEGRPYDQHSNRLIMVARKSVL